MLINKLLQIYFSPTHSTEKIVLAIARGWNISEQRSINLNTLEQRHNFKVNLSATEAVILGIPVYEERVPNLLYPALWKIRGNNNLMVLIVTYGNISAGITLYQLSKMMNNQGFKIIAAANFISEHAFSQEDIQIAPGRPDTLDLEKAEQLGRQIRQKIELINNLNTLPDLNISGELLPVGKLLPKHSEILFTHAPEIIPTLCQHCLKCVELCPVKAINPKNLQSREKLCIRCCACVKLCPHHARKIIFKQPLLVKTFLKRIGRKRKEPDIYI